MRSGTQSYFTGRWSPERVKPFTKLTNFTKSFVQKPFVLVPVFWRFGECRSGCKASKVHVVPSENLA